MTASRLAVVVESRQQQARLAALDFKAANLEAAYLHAPGLRPEKPAPAHEIGSWPSHAGADATALPDFAALASALAAVEPRACVVTGSGALARAAALIADLMAVPVLHVVDAPQDLRQAADRPLVLLGNADLMPLAVDDPRYGGTLLPVQDEDGRGLGIVETVARWAGGRLVAVPPELSIVVPAYKEAANLELVCDRLLAMIDDSGINAEILLIDDASPDDTYRVALAQMRRSARIRAFSKPLPRGMGNGIRFGLTKARAAHVAVTMADGSDEVARIPEMLAKVRDEAYGLAIGSRYRQRRNYQSVPLLYRFWSVCFRLVTRLFIGVKLSDYTNAFRLFDRRIFERYGPESGGFEISPEITFRAWFATRRVAEVDVCHLKRAAGQSSFSFLRAGPGYGKMLTKAFIQRLTGKWFVLDW